MATRISEVFVISKEVIKITFTQDLAVDSHYLTVSNYQITPSATVIVGGVINPGIRAVTEVVLLVRGLTEGQEYRIDLAAGTLREIDGTPIVDLDFSWVHRKTKVDLAVNSIPESFDTYSRSTLRGVLEALMISDEEIGGDF